MMKISKLSVKRKMSRFNQYDFIVKDKPIWDYKIPIFNPTINYY